MSPLLKLEQEVLEEGREWTRQRLEKRLQEEADQVGKICPESGLVLKNPQRRPMELRTVSGVVKLTLWYGWSSCLKKWVAPLREAWGLKPYQRTSPELESRLCFTATTVSSYEAAAETSCRWGTAVSDDLIRQTVQRCGACADQLEFQEPESPEEESEFSLVIMMDGWMVRERGPGWGNDRENKSPPGKLKRCDWHEVKSAVIYRLDQRAQTQSGRGMLLEKYVVACPPETDPIQFGQAVQQEAMRRGLARARHVYVIIDGAVWLWNLVQDRFSEAVKALDFYHAGQHLWAVGHELYGDGSAEAKIWVEGLLHQLRHGEDQKVLQTLEELPDTLTQSPIRTRENVEREVQYFRNHRDHISYKAMADSGAPIGSGAVESLARQLQNRFKGCGKFWKRPGLTNLLALVITFKNQDDHHIWN